MGWSRDESEADLTESNVMRSYVPMYTLKVCFQPSQDLLTSIWGYFELLPQNW